MSGRSTRTRAKSARALAAEEAQLQEKPKPAAGTPSSKKRAAATKAKYLLQDAAADSVAQQRSRTPSSRSSSRAPSPPPNDSASLASSSSSSGRRASTRKRTPAAAPNPISVTPTISKSGRRSGYSSPGVSRGASRASSVASNGNNHHGSSSSRRSKGKASAPSSSKSSGGRGYNPGLVNYKDSEYHYGSDFEDEDEDLDVDPVDSDHSDESSDLDEDGPSDSDDLVESDVDLDILPDSRPTTPTPFWLRTEDDEEEAPPALELPKSSEDLLIGNDLILDVISIYEILRRFGQILRLTPFRIEDFCASLASEEQSNLLSEVHIALLKLLIRSEEANSTTFGPLDQKDSINSILYFMDSVTWPESLRAFLKSDPVAYAIPLEIMRQGEYPIANGDAGPNATAAARVKMLSFLTAQILSTSQIRDFITDDGQLAHEEHCRVCFRVGEMLVCDTCPGVYHLGCLDPPLHDVPEEEWKCYLCTANEVDGVTDCASHETDKGGMLRQDTLGFDRLGNKYWFVCRRLVIELAKGGGVAYYYSTVKQLEELSEVLDDEIYEKELWEAMEFSRVEMERQMDITERITNSKKAASRKSYFELENGNKFIYFSFVVDKYFLVGEVWKECLNA